MEPVLAVVGREGGRLMIIGASHRSSAAATRDALYVPETRQKEALERVRDAGLGQALLISTCARTEIHVVHPDPEEAARRAREVLSSLSGLDLALLTRESYVVTDDAAVRHLFLLTASLDSPVPGEPQITGQVRDSHRRAKTAGMAGPELEAVLQAAYGAAKRVRSETAVGERPVSIAGAAVQLARDIHGDPERAAGLLIAGGDMGQMIAEFLLNAGLGRLTVTAALPARAELTARRFGCHHAPISDLPALLADADIVISAQGSGRIVIDTELATRALEARRRRPIFLIDAAIPGDVQPRVNELDGAFLYELDDLEQVAHRGRAARDAAAADAYEIVDEAVAAFLRDRAARGATPLVAALRGHFDLKRREVLDTAPGAGAEEATRLLIQKLLHEPSRGLAHLAASGGDVGAAERLLRRLFGIERKGAGNEGNGT